MSTSRARFRSSDQCGSSCAQALRSTTGVPSAAVRSAGGSTMHGSTRSARSSSSEAVTGGPARFVGVGHQHDIEVVVVGVAGDAGGDGGVGGLGAEQADGAVAGLGGGERVGHPFAHHQQRPPRRAGGDGEGDAGVGGEGGGRVVVLAAGGVDVEVAGLDEGDLPGRCRAPGTSPPAPCRRGGRVGGASVGGRGRSRAGWRASSLRRTRGRAASHAPAGLAVPTARRRRSARTVRRQGPSSWPAATGGRLAGIGGSGRSGIIPARVASQSTASARVPPRRISDEVDGVAAVVAGPAAPPFVAVAVGVHRHRGPVVVVVGGRAVPLAARARTARPGR